MLTGCSTFLLDLRVDYLVDCLPDLRDDWLLDFRVGYQVDNVLGSLLEIDIHPDTETRWCTV